MMRRCFTVPDIFVCRIMCKNDFSQAKESYFQLDNELFLNFKNWKSFYTYVLKSCYHKIDEMLINNTVNILIL